MTLTKNDVISNITSTGIPKNIAEESTEYIIKTIKKTLLNQEDILITGFGKFMVREKNERKGRNPSTGDTLILKKRRVISFKCSKKLKNQINE